MNDITQDLKPGDIVVINDGHRYGRYSFATVTKVTATRINTADAAFMRSTQIRVGDSDSYFRTTLATTGWGGGLRLMTVEEAQEHNAKRDQEQHLRGLAAKLSQVHRDAWASKLTAEEMEALLAKVSPQETS